MKVTLRRFVDVDNIIAPSGLTDCDSAPIIADQQKVPNQTILGCRTPR